MVAVVDNPTGADVAAVMNRAGDETFVNGAASLFADMAREAASSYTRGRGFEDDESIPRPLKWVILLRAVRMATNYMQLQSQALDGASMVYGAGASGWTIHELTALDDYRRTACSIS